MTPQTRFVQSFMNVRRFFDAGPRVATLVVALAGAGIVAALPSAAAAQQRTEAPAPGYGAIAGKVVDRDGNPIGGVLITIEGKDGKKSLNGQVMTQASGMFLFNDLPTNVLFRLAFAKRDYAIEIRDNVFVIPDDQRQLTIALQKNAVQLGLVKIVAKPPEGSSQARRYIDSDELKKLNVPSLYDALNRARPMFMAERHRGEVCMPPDTALTLYVNGLRRPLFDPVNLDSMANAALGTGSQQPTSSATNTKSAQQTALEEELRMIRPEDVLQIRYVGCNDTPPEDIPRRNVIWVVMKPGRH